MIRISIDLRLIDQSRCKKVTRKNGEAATFGDLILIETPNGQYGDYAVKQDMTQEERASGLQLPFLGNGKILGQRPQGDPPSRPKPPAKNPAPDPDLDAPADDIPF